MTLARQAQQTTSEMQDPLRVAELFAGVGGFRLGLETRTQGRDFQVVWSNQWEPRARKQWASHCYAHHFGSDGHVCEDISRVLDDVEAGCMKLPDHDLLVGGFPCQDYSVAKPLNQAQGLQGQKGVLWWDIHRLLNMKRPRFVLLENVDRLLKSPGRQRGRDFAVILACLARLGYSVEWRVVNAADYGFAQRRRRVFLFGHRRREAVSSLNPLDRLTMTGVLARALPVQTPSDVSASAFKASGFRLLEGTSRFDDDAIIDISRTFGHGDKVSRFRNAGLMVAGHVWTLDAVPDYHDGRLRLADVLSPVDEVEPAFFIPEQQVDKWLYLKGAKREERTHKASGAIYTYTEGALPFPDPVDRPARTILTGEGGSGPSRFRHVISANGSGYRRLMPVELERLNGFPEGWTDTGMSDVMRAFCMGNALVVGVVERIGREMRGEADKQS